MRWGSDSGQQSTVNGQRSTVNGQQSTVPAPWATILASGQFPLTVDCSLLTLHLSCLAHWKTSTDIAPQIQRFPGTHMRSPPSCWSSSGERSQVLGAERYQV